MKKEVRYCLMLTLFLFIGVTLYAQKVTYRTEKLKTMANLLSLSGIDTLSSGGHFIFLYKSYPVVVDINSHREVTHIGVSLFKQEIRNANPSPVYDFLERYLLEMCLLGDSRKVDKQMKANDVAFEVGGLNMIKLLNENLVLSVSYDNSKRYQVNWTQNGIVVLALSFPIQYELLIGSNKIEIENNFKKELMQYVYHTIQPGRINQKDLTPTWQSEYFVKGGETYLSDLLNSNLYYKKQAQFSLITDVNHPSESVANLMISTETPGDFSLSIKQYKYGYKQEIYTVPLKQWIGFCVENGCKPFFGVEALKDNILTGSVIMVNEQMGYNHILFIRFDLADLTHEKGIIDATLNSYVPMHNVTDLFFEYREKRNTTLNTKMKL